MKYIGKLIDMKQERGEFTCLKLLNTPDFCLLNSSHYHL